MREMKGMCRCPPRIFPLLSRKLFNQNSVLLLDSKSNEFTIAKCGNNPSISMQWNISQTVKGRKF